jgi:isoamylase
MMSKWGELIVALLVVYASVSTVNVNGQDYTGNIDNSPLGARYTSSGVRFGVYSRAAERIEAWLYPKSLGLPVKTIVLTKGPDSIWRGEISFDLLRGQGISDAVYYGYRAWGPNWHYDASWTPGSGAGFVSDVDKGGNRFNPNKLLLDQYALEVSHDPIDSDYVRGMYATGIGNRLRDSGPIAPKGILIKTEPPAFGTKPERALKDDIIYEVHVRGLTMNDTSVPEEFRGTYRGAAMKAQYLASLGVTAVEFLPLQETINDQNDLNPGITTDHNYWGYQTLNYFSPDRRYAYDRSPGGPTREVQELIRAMHDAGLKVYIDVVYNHTAEGGLWTPGTDPRMASLYSFRGLDNPTYYSLTGDMQFPWDNTGCGGNVNTRNPVTQRLIADSLKYWVDVLGADGFRFDLASVLGNTCEHGCFNYNGADQNTAMSLISRELPMRPASGGPGVDLIAEPWAIGGNSYQGGGFPQGWAEWNGMFRDALRISQNRMGTVPFTPGMLATRVAGSSDMFAWNGRRPGASINFLTAHDGFTLADLYQCNDKNNNQPLPYGPSDGGSENNISWDQNRVPSDQRKAERNGLALLLLSAGTPMMVGGDEHLRSINCNNNPYNLDTSANWLPWTFTAGQENFYTFTQRLVAFRRAHPALHPLNFYSAGDYNGNGLGQLDWFMPDGKMATTDYFTNPSNHALGWRIDGSELSDPSPAIFIAYNGWLDMVNFTLPSAGPGRAWFRALDTCTAFEGPDQFRPAGSEDFIGGAGTTYGVCGRGVLVLIAK